MSRLIGGMQFPYRGPEIVPESMKAPDYVATDAIKTLMPECIALVVDIWSNADDAKIISAIDRDGTSLIDDFRLGTDGEQLILHAMIHDIDQWLHVHKMPQLRGEYANEWRLWQWTQSNNIKPLGPFYPFAYFEKV